MIKTEHAFIKTNMNEKIGFMTVPSKELGEKIADALVEQHLVACVNIIPQITSIYRWKGQVCKESELLCIMKTTEDKIKVVIQKVRELHSYEVPEIIFLPIESGLPAYLQWIQDQTQ
jgi:uncharacterized protein involved in tolerance to divalent cations